jgi:hypothetical protein
MPLITNPVTPAGKIKKIFPPLSRPEAQGAGKEKPATTAYTGLAGRHRPLLLIMTSVILMNIRNHGLLPG